MASELLTLPDCHQLPTVTHWREAPVVHALRLIAYVPEDHLAGVHDH
jgi:hypothetical protein